MSRASNHPVTRIMVDKVINALIAGVVGAVSFIAVSALVKSSIYGPNGDHAYTWCDVLVGGGEGAIPTNTTNCTTVFTPSAAELMIHDILPLAIAIMVIAGLFMGLTKVRGV